MIIGANKFQKLLNNNDARTEFQVFQVIQINTFKVSDKNSPKL